MNKSDRKKKLKTVKINKERVWQALRWELSDEELEAMPYIDIVYEKDYYFDLELMLDKIHRFMNDEKRRYYFMHWCLIYMRCLMDSTPYRSRKSSRVCYEAGDCFDAFAFHDGSPEECRWLIAQLKWYKHCLDNLENKTRKEFEINGVSVYVLPDIYIENSDTDLYQILIADRADKKFNIFFVDGIDYDENVNYTFVEDDESLQDIVYNRFSLCKLDRSLDFDYYKFKKEFIK